MTLFNALCSGRGISNRGSEGFTFESNCVLKLSEYHNWSEFYKNNAWNLADPQKRNFLKHRKDYIAVKIIEHIKEEKEYFGMYKYSENHMIVTMN